MSRRRPVAWLGALAFAAAAMLLFAWKLREGPGTPALPLLDPNAVALESRPSTPATTAAPADAAPAGEPARADAPPEPLDPALDEVDEFTASGLREARALEREVTCVIGRVVDSEGEPVAGARVLVSCALTLASAELDAQANRGRVREDRTDALGRFRVANVDSGLARLSVRHAHHAPFDLRDFALPPGEATDVGELQLALGTVLAGRVLDPEMRPVAGARIVRTRAPLLGPVHKLGGLFSVALGESDTLGRFELPALERGALTLVVQAQEFPDAIFELDTRSPSPQHADLELVLQRGVSIRGHVREHDPSRTGPLEAVALPYDGMRLLAAAQLPGAAGPQGAEGPRGAEGSWLADVRVGAVDPFGRFEVPGLVPGRAYALRAVRAGKADRLDPREPDAWAPFSIAPAGAQDVELGYLPGSRIELQALDRFSGAPIERLRVQLAGAWSDEFPPLDPVLPVLGAGRLRSLWPQGRVVLENLRVGAAGGFEEAASAEDEDRFAMLTLQSPGYDDLTLRGLRLEAGQFLDLGPVSLSPLAIQSVRVSDAADGKPLAGARAELFLEGAANPLGRTRSEGLTDGRGLVRLTALPAATAALVVSRSGYGPARFLVPMDTAPGRPAFEALLQREARVRVLVRDTRGVPAPAVELVLERQRMPDRMSWRRTARTDALGLAVFSEVPVGVFDLFPEARLLIGIPSGDGLGRDNRRVVELAAGADFLAELEVPALSRLSGTIWIGREPLVNARLTLGPPRADFAGLGTDQQRFESARSLRSDSGGRFGPLELQEGNYALLIEQAELGVRTLRSLRVERGENDVILDVDDTAITGHVGDARGAPLAGVLVRAFVDRPGPREDIRPTEGEFLVPFEEYRTPVAASVTDAQGNYRLRCVPPGRRLELSFSLGRRSIARPRIHVPLGRTLENVNAALPDPGALELVLHAPLPAPGLHHGVRIVGLDQPEGFSLFGASFAESGPGAGRAVFDELVPGRWVVLVAAVDDSLVIVEQREPQVVEVLPGKTTEFSVGW